MRTTSQPPLDNEDTNPEIAEVPKAIGQTFAQLLDGHFMTPVPDYETLLSLIDEAFNARKSQS